MGAMMDSAHSDGKTTGVTTDDARGGGFERESVGEIVIKGERERE